jgi:hypothetical protein
VSTWKDISAAGPSGNTCFGRVLSPCWSGGALWAAVQTERGGANTVALLNWAGGQRRELLLEADGHCQQPCLTAPPDGGVFLGWNQVSGEEWRIRCARVGPELRAFEDVETVARAGGLCLPPAAAFFREEARIAWPQLDGENIRVRVAARAGGSWGEPQAISPPGLDAFRPHLAATPHRLFLTWDQYDPGLKRYEIGFAHFDGKSWSPPGTLSGEGERRLGPRLLATGGGEVYLTWVVLREVGDRWGVVDHFPSATAARWTGDDFAPLPDEANGNDTRIVADFREGLLASENYRGYFGLRRRPQLAASESGDVWLLWESTPEEVGGRRGRLLGRRLGSDGRWGEVRLLLGNDVYGHAVPERFAGPGIPCVFFVGGKVDFEAIACDFADPEGDPLPPAAPSRWERWRPARPAIPAKPERTCEVGGKRYRLFWADTHCHGAMSPDAEGETDELIYYARDVAGLDAVCVIDNDYYPCKALTQAEWAVHGEFSRHFTREGRFVVFPGWEFTFHRPDLKPNHNHRCVIYPRAGGPLLRSIDPASDTERKLAPLALEAGAMCPIHHCHFERTDPEAEWNVEVCSSWRVCIEESDLVVRLLREGHRFGFMGASDSHRSVPGLGGALTGIYAEELTPEALFEAYRARRIVATQGQFVHLDFRVAGVFIGGEGECPGPPEITAAVEAPEAIERAEVLRDGEVIHTAAPGEKVVELSFRDADASPGEHFYFLRVKTIGDPGFNCDPAENRPEPFSQQGTFASNLARSRGPFAWSSPVWLTLK